MNERITENIVRDLLQTNGWYKNDDIIIEEQISDNPRINKLLKTASKTGKGRGMPEFIISFKNNSDLLIIIECKANNLFHESKTGDKYTQYAVDGVLLYASYLKLDFNIIALAISGQSKRDMKISSFLWLKENYFYKKIQDKLFPNPLEISSVLKDELKPLKESEVIDKAIEYNSFLHNYSIPENERCTLISAILISLQDLPFLHSYKLYSSNKELIDEMLNACERVLKNNNLDVEKLNILVAEYSKFKNSTDFSSDKIYNKKTKKDEPNTLLKDFIISISNSILPYIKQSQFDILGKFYTEFIRYANGDKKTGLVLTPPHITELFCYIANLSVNDIVFDPCCGTAGFLVAAMNYMLSKAGNNKEKQKQIKSNQLIGIEKRTDMFSHACSNMMMRGDGKSKIICGDCFSEKNKEFIKTQYPTVGFLNPPYQDGNAAEQLNFVFNTLECLNKSGICVAICQMSTVVSDKNDVLLIKEKLLEKHTLKAVFSMPNDLFSPVGVITCILVFEAHIPHSNIKETFFGYFKNDGFVKTKKGRIDSYNTWQEIRTSWISAYQNNKKILGLCTSKVIKYNDEWCAEAYMETDYSILNDKLFIEKIKNYLRYLIKIDQAKLSKNKNDDSLVKLNKSIFDENWCSFEIGKIFSIKRGSSSKKPLDNIVANDNEENIIPYIGSSEQNNGCTELCNSEKINKNKIEKENSITLANNGSVGSAFYQPNIFMASSDVTILYNEKLNKYNSLFLITIISLEKFKYSYGRKWSNNKIANTKIKLPINEFGEINWELMEDYIKSLNYSEYI